MGWPQKSAASAVPRPPENGLPPPTLSDIPARGFLRRTNKESPSHCDHIAGLRDGAKAQTKSFEGTAGHGYVAGREVAAHIRRAAGNLTPQRLYPGRKIVARAVLGLAAHDAAQNQI